MVVYGLTSDWSRQVQAYQSKKGGCREPTEVVGLSPPTANLIVTDSWPPIKRVKGKVGSKYTISVNQISIN